MSQNVELPRVTRVTSVVGLDEASARGRSTTTYTVSRSFRNALGYPVSIIDRNNIIATIPPSNFSTGTSELIVEHRLNFSDNVNLNWDTVFNEASSNPTIESIRELTKSRDVRMTTMGQEIIVEYSISHATLASKSFTAYFEELDIVVTKSTYAHNVVHPYSTVGQNLVTASSDNVDGFYYRVIINDPFNEFGERYINVNGSVFKVRRTVDNTIRQGVYVYSRDACKNDNLYEPGLGTEYYSFDEADKSVPLYGTSQLAASLGDAYYKQEENIKLKENEAKRKLAELNIKKIELDSKLKDMEHKYKQENMELERENMRLKDELEREKAYRERATQREKFEYESRSRAEKDSYESRSHARKDTTEFMKWLPNIITAIVSIAGVLVALQKTKA